MTKDRIEGPVPLRRLTSRALAAAVAPVVAMALLAPGSASAATIAVTTDQDVVADDGSCSLREAVSAASDNTASSDTTGACPAGDPTLDMIVLSVTYTLTLVNPGPAQDGEDANATGDLDLTGGGPVVITGVNSSVTAIDANSIDRVFDLPNGGTLTLRDLKVANGVAKDPFPAFGGGIWGRDTSEIVLEDVRVENNHSPVGGGGIQMSGAGSSLTLIDSFVEGNSVAATPNQGGGGLQTGGSLTISGGAVWQNTAFSDANSGGGGIRALGPTEISNSIISQNSTGDGNAAVQNGGKGGAIFFRAVAGPITLEITSTTLASNSSEDDGGAIHASGADASVEIEGSTLQSNTSATEESGKNVEGGAIHLADASLDVSATRFVLNKALGPPAPGTGIARGGALFLDGPTNLETSSIQTNSVSVGAGEAHGGAVATADDAETRIAASTLESNSAFGDSAEARGGAIADRSLGGTTTTVINSTLYNNGVVSGTGVATGGAIQALNATGLLEVISTTVAGNSAPLGGLALHRTSGFPDFELKNTIIDDGPDACAKDQGDFTSLGHNIDAGASCVDGSVTGDLTTTDPMLESIGENGGPPAGSPPFAMRTRALAPTSPAVDKVPAAACTDESNAPLTTDQRGFLRPSPSNGACDSGAYELAQPEPPTPPAPPAPPVQTSSVQPPNAFTFGKLKRKKNKGIAFLIAFVPGPGEVGLAGKGIKNRGLAATARKAISTDGGRVKLKIKPAKKGKKARKLRQRLRFKGKAKVKVRVTYLPAGGTANTRTKKLKLIRR